MHKCLSNHIKSEIRKKLPSTRMSYNLLATERVQKMCHLSKAQISEIHNDTEITEQDLLIVLTILRQGISQHFAATLFECHQSTVSRTFDRVIKVANERWTSKYIGASAFTRQDILLNHTPEFTQILIPNAFCTVDATYLYLQKFKHFEGQFTTFNGHKKRNLAKMLAFQLLDGTWLEFLSPSLSDGSHNDQWLTNAVFGDVQENDNLPDQIKNVRADFDRIFDKSTDVLVCDRGFDRRVCFSNRVQKCRKCI